MLGAWLALGGANTLHFLVRSRTRFLLGLIYLAFAAVMTLAGTFPELQGMFPRLFEAFNPNDKTNLAPYRFLHLAILIIVVVRLYRSMRRDCRPPFGGRWSNAGSNPSRCFASESTFRSSHPFVLETTSDGVFAQLLVGTGGLAIMTAVAYYRSWSKRVEKPVHADTYHPTAEQAHAPYESAAGLAAGGRATPLIPGGRRTIRSGENAPPADWTLRSSA